MFKNEIAKISYEVNFKEDRYEKPLSYGNMRRVEALGLDMLPGEHHLIGDDSFDNSVIDSYRKGIVDITMLKDLIKDGNLFAIKILTVLSKEGNNQALRLLKKILNELEEEGRAEGEEGWIYFVLLMEDEEYERNQEHIERLAKKAAMKKYGISEEEGETATHSSISGDGTTNGPADQNAYTMQVESAGNHVDESGVVAHYCCIMM
jgi:hypothetical protein